MQESKHQGKISWFWRWFLNNQMTAVLLNILLFLLVVFTFTKVSYLFEPVWQFLAVVGLPIIMAGILYYLMNPLVDLLENKGVKRVYSIIGLFIVVIALIVWGIVVIIPSIQSQTMSFINHLPGYIETIQKLEAFDKLKRASAECLRIYKKGKISFELLAQISPQKVRESSPWADRFILFLTEEVRKIS